MATTTCSNCGAHGTGKFCNSCGTALSRPQCPSCNTPITAGSGYCHECGARVAGGGGGQSSTSKPWIIAGGIAVVVALTAVVWATAARPAAPAATVATVPRQPDLSMMTPQQQADSLFNAVMWSHSSGDQAGVRMFAPMALEAYAAVGRLSNDARYHVGTIYSVSGPMEMALVQADSLELDVSGHLFSSMLRGSVARVRGDTLELNRAYRTFLANYESEMASSRSEYLDHPSSIEGFLAQASTKMETTGPEG